MLSNDIISAIIALIYVFLIVFPLFLLSYLSNKLITNSYLHFTHLSTLAYKVSFLLSMGFAVYLLSFNDNVISKLAFEIAPDYFFGLQLYNGWTYIGFFLIPLFLYIFFRIFNLLPFDIPISTHNLLSKKPYFFITLFLVLLMTSFLIYQFIRFNELKVMDSLRSAASPGLSIKDNIYVNESQNIIMKLFPRNGTWAQQLGFDLLNLPASQNNYGIAISTYKILITDGGEKFINIQNNNIEEILSPSSKEVETFFKNNIEWTIYQEITNFADDHNFTAVGKYRDIYYILRFNYRSNPKSFINEQAYYHFIKMVESFKVKSDK